jgi:hypothetical protein
MTAEEIVDLLEARELAPKRTGPGVWTSRCPAHSPDRKPSFSISEGVDGRVLVCCHRGCELDDVLTALGVTAADLFVPNGNGGQTPPIEYLYEAADGTPVMKVVRRPGKKFAQARPDGAGGWVWNLRGVDRVLYRLPKVIAAVAAGETVYVAEGEKDVHALEAKGVTATTNPGGCGKWRPEFSKTLPGANVCVIADADEPGRKHAETVAESLRDQRCRVRIVEAAAGKDAHEHFAAGHGVEDFRVQGDIDTEPAGQASEAPEVESIRRALFEDSIDVWDAGDTIREEAPGTEGLLHAGIAVEMFADRGAGKSSVALMLGTAHAAAGGRVAYFDRENSPSLSKARLKAIMDANAWPDLRKDGRFVCRHYPSIGRWEGEHVAEAIAGLGFTGVVFDSLREFLGQLALDPDSEADVTVFFTTFVTPLLQRGLWVLLLDNVGHDQKHRPKGSATKLDACPQGYLVETTSKFSPEKIGAIRITCKRSRYGDEDHTWTMRIGGGLFGVPQPDSTTDSAKRAQAATDERESFRQAVLGVLMTEAPLSRDNLKSAIRKAGGTVGRRAQEFLSDFASDPTSGIEHTHRGYQIAEHTLPLRPDTNTRVTPPDTEPAGQARVTPSGDTPQTPSQSHDRPDTAPRVTPVSGQGDTPVTPLRKGDGCTHGTLEEALQRLNTLPEDEAEREWQRLQTEHAL